MIEYDRYLNKVYHITIAGAYHFSMVYTVPYCPITIRKPYRSNKRWRVTRPDRKHGVKKICEVYRLKDYWYVVMGL